MTSPEFQQLWKRKVIANPAWQFGAKNKDTTTLYWGKLRHYHAETLSEAVDRLLEDIDKNNFLPPVAKFIQFCQWVLSEQVKEKTRGCPCCGSSGTVVFHHTSGRHAGNDVAYRCRCALGENIDSRIRSVEKTDFDICDNLDCQNLGKRSTITVPAGSYHYHKSLRDCKVVEALTEEKKSDVPGISEGEIPF